MSRRLWFFWFCLSPRWWEYTDDLNYLFILYYYHRSFHSDVEFQIFGQNYWPNVFQIIKSLLLKYYTTKSKIRIHHKKSIILILWKYRIFVTVEPNRTEPNPNWTKPNPNANRTQTRIRIKTRTNSGSVQFVIKRSWRKFEISTVNEFFGQTKKAMTIFLGSLETFFKFP